MNNQTPTLRSLLDGSRVSQLLYVVAELGIADLLKDGPRHYSDLAVACGGHPQALFRVLCGLASSGIITRLDDAHFALNQLIPTSLAFHLIEALAI